MKLRPFTIEIAEEQIDDLRARLQNIRWPSALDGESWSDGASLTFMKRLTDYWRDRFDWRAQEKRLNQLPQYIASVNGADVHFVHQPGVGDHKIPLVLTHGWPGSFVEMERLIPMLADPASHGADPADSFDIVVPSLPGYGFSPAPTEPGCSSREIALLWKELMNGLGYTRFAAQGGDIGAGVSMWLARLFPQQVIAIHLNYIPGSFQPSLEGGPASRTADEKAFVVRAADWMAAEGAYASLQGTKPQTLAFSLSDSPIGLAAWIAEKFHGWSDCDGDIERAVSLDALLTDVSLYWFSDSIAATLRLYKENRANPLAFAPGERVAPPLGVALFPRELPLPPRSWVERVFEVRQWNSMPSGGHFAALERPELLAADIRAFFRPLRAGLPRQ